MPSSRQGQQPARQQEANQQTETGQRDQQSQAVQGTGGARGAQGGLARRQQYGLSPLSDPFGFMQTFTEEMDRLFEDFGFGRSPLSRRGPGGWGTGSTALGRRGLGGAGLAQAGWSPQIEIFEREGNIVVRADLPGLEKDDVKVEVNDDALIIQGERRHEHEDRQEGYFRSERSYGSFYRAIPLPDGVDAENANATFRNGVLEVTVPAPKQQGRARRLEIRDAGPAQGQAQQTPNAKEKGK
jgi:HSP20 family protein